MSRGISNTEKKIYYNEHKVVIKDAKDALIGVFPLKKVCSSDIQNYRRKVASIDPKKRTKAILIIKNNNAYYLAVIPKGLSLTTVVSKHLCGNCTNCYASSNKHSGCPKISDRLFEVTIRANSMPNAIKFSSRLEKYLFISTGIETFGCEASDIFIVTECKHYCVDSREPKKATFEVAEKLFATYQEIENRSKDAPIPYVKRYKKVFASYSTHPYE